MNASPLQRTSNETSISSQVGGKLIEARARDMQRGGNRRVDRILAPTVGYIPARYWLLSHLGKETRI